jgi:DNA anti-recombination protein RmuC
MKKENDYLDYSDKEIEERIEEIKDILSENFDELGQNLGIELSEETRLSIKSVIYKTNQLLDHEFENTIRLLERNYRKLPKEMRDELESGN